MIEEFDTPYSAARLFAVRPSWMYSVTARCFSSLLTSFPFIPLLLYSYTVFTKALQFYFTTTDISNEKPDCVAYNSVAKKGGVNFLFFEKGFKKLSLREVTLKIGTKKDKGYRYKKTICCAGTSDYTPFIKAYGNYFVPIAEADFDSDYLESDEYIKRKKALENR